MQCRRCGKKRWKVTRTIAWDDHIARERECQSCRLVVKTVEQIDEDAGAIDMQPAAEG